MIVRENDGYGLSLDPGLGCTQVDAVRRGKLFEVVRVVVVMIVDPS